MALGTARSVLVIHLAGLGDLIMGLRSLAMLRAACPSARITLLTWRRNGELAPMIPGVDGRVLLDERSGPAALARNARAVLALRRMRFDVAINLYQVYRRSGVWKLAALLRGIAPKTSVGRDTDGKGFCFDRKISEQTTEPLHEVERQARVMSALGAAATTGSVGLALAASDRRTLDQWLSSRRIGSDEPVVVINPGGARAQHRWPWTSFIRLGQALEAQGVRVILAGQPGERQLAERIAAQLRCAVIAAGDLPLGPFAWLLQRSRLLVANDSGATHLAAALGTPVIAITGPGDPQRFGPYPINAPGHVTVHAEGCEPCYRYACRGHAALERLPVAPVLDAARALLAGQRIGGLVRASPRVGVLHVHTVPVVSGSGINTLLSMDGLPRDRFEPALACGRGLSPGEPLLELVEQRGMAVHRLRHMVWGLNPLQDVLVVWELVRLMRRHRFTVVHTHNSKAGFVGRLAARLAGVPAVVHTVHGFAFHDQEAPWKRWLYRTLERLASGWCDRLIMISQPLVDWAVRDRIAPRERMVKIYSGIDLGAFHAPADRDRVRASLGLPQDAFVIGEVAKLWDGKGHDVLFEASAQLAARIPSLRVLVVGDGELRPSLERLAQRLGIAPRVCFTGFRDDVPSLLRALDVAVLPSRFEGMGRAVVEAQAAGRAVVASRVGGIPDVIEHERTGLLVPPGDAQALARAIERLHREPSLREQLGQAARRAVNERFDARTMVRQIIGVYDALLSHSGSPA